MTIICPVDEMDELELKIAASSAIDKKTVALHVRRLNAAAGLATGPSTNAMGKDRLPDVEVGFDNAPI